MSRSRRRRWPLAVTVVAVIVVAYVVLTAVFFVRPGLGKVGHPQAVVVLGGYGDRFQRAVTIAREDGVHLVEVSGFSGGR
ncbi:MAG TPA: hypothetical protein VHW47_10015, partial [Acidimicrobiales bacterium]|nr:hypothetical protein [Acidimicrobiales bacterium]